MSQEQYIIMDVGGPTVKESVPRKCAREEEYVITDGEGPIVEESVPRKHTRDTEYEENVPHLPLFGRSGKSPCMDVPDSALKVRNGQDLLLIGGSGEIPCMDVCNSTLKAQGSASSFHCEENSDLDNIAHYDCLCTHRCRELWIAGLRKEFKMFEDHLQKCDDIKHHMFNDQVLQLDQVRSFSTTLWEQFKIACINVHLMRVKAKYTANTLREYGNFLLQQNIHLVVHESSFKEVLEEHKTKFPYLSEYHMEKSLMTHMFSIPKSELKNSDLSEDTKKKILKIIERRYEYHEKLVAAAVMLDPFDEVFRHVDGFF